MAAQSLQRAFGKRGSKRDRHAADSQDAEKREYPVGDILHQNAHAVAPSNPTSLKAGGDAALNAKLQAAFRTDPALRAGSGIDAPLAAYIGRAIAQLAEPHSL